MILGGGKRIRPAYCHWGWLLGGGDPDGDGALDGGCALEILHAFALAHDDVMDGSDTRRGAPTVWRKFVQRHRDRGWHGEDRRFGEAAAVLAGDMAMVLADRTLGRVSAETRAVLGPAAHRAEHGPVPRHGRLGPGKHHRGQRPAGSSSTRRPATPWSVRCSSARRWRGRADLAEPLARHGRPVGLAFQLRDDVLGAFGDPDATGKPVGDDLREGKPTLLIALARAAATPAQTGVLDRVGSDMDDDTVAEIQQVIVDTGALTDVEDEIAGLLDKSLDALEALPDVPAAKDALAAAARFVALRRA